VVSEAVEEYLETIYRISKTTNGFIKINALIKNLKLSPSSVTEMVQRLAAKGYVEYKPFVGVKLTEKGRKVGESILNKHRMIERFLLEVLKIDPDKVHEEACKLEHAISGEVERKLREFLEKYTLKS